MAYRTVVEEIPANLKRTLLGTLDFRGRSTRTELITYYFVPQVLAGLSVFVLAAFFLGRDLDATRQIGNLVHVLLMVPIPALFVRRVHDHGRTGWWALLLPLTFAFAVVSDNGNPDIAGIAKLETPFWLDLIGVGAILAIWGLSLWPPNDDSNRYGPNPRLDQDELPA